MKSVSKPNLLGPFVVFRIDRFSLILVKLTRNFIIYSSVNRGFRFIRWFSPGTLISSANKNDRYDIAKILLKVALNAIKSHRLIQCSIQTGFTVLIYMFITITQCVLLIRIHVHGHNVIIEWNEKCLVTNVLVC